MYVKFQGGIDDKLKAGALARKLNSMRVISLYQDGVEIQFIGIDTLYSRVMSHGYIPVAGKDFEIKPTGTFSPNPDVGYDFGDDDDGGPEDEPDESVTPPAGASADVTRSEVVEAAVLEDEFFTPLYLKKRNAAQEVAYDRAIATERRRFARWAGQLYISDGRLYDLSLAYIYFGGRSHHESMAL